MKLASRTSLPVALVVAAVVLSSGVAAGQDKVRPIVKGRTVVPVQPPPQQPTPPSPPVGTPPAPPAAVDAGAVADAGVKEKGKEGPDQKKRRLDYVARITKEARAIVRSDGVITAEEKELMRQHWRRSIRAHRIKLLAEDEKDGAIVGRVDAYLAKIEKTLMDRLKELNKKAAPAAAKADGGAK